MRIEITKQDLKKRIGFIKDFKEELLKRVVVSNSPISNDFFKKQQWDDILGSSFNDTLQLARSEGYMILSDDAVFRSLAMGEMNRIGFSTVMLVQYLLDTKVITDEEWRLQTTKFIQLNYHYMPVNGFVIYDCFDADGFTPGIFAERAVQTLLTARNRQVKAKVTADFLQSLYSNSNLMDKRDTGATWILHKYFQVGSDALSRQILLFNIEDRFKFLPIQKDTLISILNRLFPARR